MEGFQPQSKREDELGLEPMEESSQNGTKMEGSAAQIFDTLKGEAREDFLRKLSDPETRELFRNRKPKNDYTPAEREILKNAGCILLTLENAGIADEEGSMSREIKMNQLLAKLTVIDNSIRLAEQKKLENPSSINTAVVDDLKAQKVVTQRELNALANVMMLE